MAKDRFYRFILKAIGPLVRLLTCMKVQGREHLPASGGYVVGFNHPGIFDPFVVAAAHRTPLYMLGKKEEFDRPVTGHILRQWLRMLPLDRSGGDNQWALDEAVARIHQGERFALAPEGTSSHFGPLGRGRSGLARMALAAGVPMVPCALWRRRGGRMKAVFAAPLDTMPWHGMQDDRDVVRELTDRFMARLAELLEEEYDGATAPDHALRKGYRRPS